MNPSAISTFIARFCDSVIFQSAVLHDPELFQEWEQHFQISLSPEETEELHRNPNVDLPVIYTSIAQRIRGTDLLFDDPPKTGTPITLVSWMQRFAAFAVLNMRNQDRAFTLVSEAASQASATYNDHELRNLIERLWKYRWIFGHHNVGLLSVNLFWQPKNQNLNINEKAHAVEQLFEELESHLSNVKKTVETLDEWLEELYLTLPLFWYVFILNKDLLSVSDEIKKRDRFLEEIFADIWTLFSTIMIGVLRKNPTIWSDLFLMWPLLGATSKNSATRDVSYYYRARIAIPRFWFEQATALLDSENPRIPEILNKFDHSHLASIIITFDVDKLMQTHIFKSYREGIPLGRLQFDDNGIPFSLKSHLS